MAKVTSMLNAGCCSHCCCFAHSNIILTSNSSTCSSFSFILFRFQMILESKESRIWNFRVSAHLADKFVSAHVVCLIHVASTTFCSFLYKPSIRQADPNVSHWHRHVISWIPQYYTHTIHRIKCRGANSQFSGYLPPFILPFTFSRQIRPFVMSQGSQTRSSSPSFTSENGLTGYNCSTCGQFAKFRYCKSNTNGNRGRLMATVNDIFLMTGSD